jgi:hypothetical protein
LRTLIIRHRSSPLSLLFVQPCRFQE